MDVRQRWELGLGFRAGELRDELRRVEPEILRVGAREGAGVDGRGEGPKVSFLQRLQVFRGNAGIALYVAEGEAASLPGFQQRVPEL